MLSHIRARKPRGKELLHLAPSLPPAHLEQLRRVLRIEMIRERTQRAQVQFTSCHTLGRPAPTYCDARVLGELGVCVAHPSKQSQLHLVESLAAFIPGICSAVPCSYRAFAAKWLSFRERVHALWVKGGPEDPLEPPALSLSRVQASFVNGALPE